MSTVYPALRLWSLALGSLCACAGSGQTAPVQTARPSFDGAAGWSAFAPSTDTRIVFVSSSQGDDALTGLSADAPKRTLAAGKAQLRHGFPDWLLLRRGDTWHESLGQWKLSGRSAG